MILLTGVTFTKLYSWDNLWRLVMRNGNSIMLTNTRCHQLRIFKLSKLLSSLEVDTHLITIPSAGSLLLRTSSGASWTNSLTSSSLAAALESNLLLLLWVARLRRCPTTLRHLSAWAESTSNSQMNFSNSPSLSDTWKRTTLLEKLSPSWFFRNHMVTMFLNYLKELLS